MSGQFDGLADGVEYPTQDQLASGPATVTLSQLLERQGFVSMHFGAGLGEDLVDSFEQVLAYGGEATRPSLGNLDEVVHEDVGVSQGFRERAVGGRSRRFVHEVRQKDPGGVQGGVGFSLIVLAGPRFPREGEV